MLFIPVQKLTDDVMEELIGKEVMFSVGTEESTIYETDVYGDENFIWSEEG